jgi:hypothetical protein
MKLVQQIQTSVLHKLLFCITRQNLDLQQKLLHLLHACLAITCASTQHGKDKSTNGMSPTISMGHQKQGSVDSVASHNNSSANEAVVLMQSTSDLFVKCVLDALTLSSNRALLQHWVDFVLASMPYIKHGFRHLLVPILMCICHQIKLRCDTIDIMIHEKPHAASCASAEKEIMVLLLGLEKMLMFCLNERLINNDWFASNVNYALPIPCIPETSALIGFAQIVHQQQQQQQQEDKPRDTIMYHLPVVLHLLLHVWHVFRRPQWGDATMQSMGEAKVDAVLHSFSYAADQAKGRLESIFEKLFKYSTVDFVEGFIEIFFMENSSALELDQPSLEEEKFDLVALDVLSCTPTSTPQHIISTLLDSIRQRTAGTYQSRRRRILRQGKL